MAWIPAVTLNGRFSGLHPDWLQIQSLFDEAINLDPLPRDDWKYLSENYIVERPGYGPIDITGGRSTLPTSFANIPLGAYEIDFIDFLLNYERNRVLVVRAPRGAGKTTFLHYVEAALQQSALSDAPIFLLVGNLAQVDSNGVLHKDINHDLCLLIAAEVTRAAERVGARFRTQLRALAVRLRAAQSPADARECFRDLAQRLKPKELRRLVIIFDNLDHLRAPVITFVLELARAIYVASRIACVVCLRPNCLAGIAARGDARAFFQFTIDLPAPTVSAWIRRLGHRLAARAEAKQVASGKALVIAQREVNPEQLLVLFETYAAALERESPQEDVLALLQAICADDTRHLVILLRRMLSHRTLPVDKLLQGSPPADFHPFPALLSGSNIMFAGDTFIPNLLAWHSDGVAAPTLLLFRLLTLLARNIPVMVAEIESRMELLGFPVEMTRKALHALHGPLLIRGVDQDSFGAEPPTQIFLTEAGEHYLHHILHNTDYLLQAAADVQGRHEWFLRSYEKDPVRLVEGSMFIERFDSLVELAEQIAKQELAQLASLTSVPPDARIRQIIDMIRQGGLLVSHLNHALSVIVERNYYSRSEFARSAVGEYDAKLNALQEAESRAGQRLDELARRKGLPTRTVTSTHRLNGPIGLEFSPHGDEVTAKAALRLPAGCTAALVLLQLREDNVELTRSVVALPSDLPAHGKPTSGENNPVSGRFSPIPAGSDTARADLKLHAYIPGAAAGNEALLCPEVSRDHVRLILRDMSRTNPPMDLSGPIPLERIRTESRRAIDHISERCLSGLLEIEDIQTVGTTLARNLLSPTGQNALATVMRSLKRVVVLSTDDDTPVPYEWLRPISHEDDVADLGMLCEHCTVVRFPQNPIEFFVCGRDRPKTPRSLCTVGLVRNGKSGWQYPLPEKWKEFRDLLSQHGILHIVGHYDEKELTVRITDSDRQQILSRERLEAFPFASKSQDIILSSCRIGALDKQNNLAQVIAATRQCAVWTPLVSITDTVAEHLDAALAETIVPDGLVSPDDVFARLRKQEAYASVYIRYGV